MSIKCINRSCQSFAYYHFRSTLKRDDFFAYVYFSNLINGFVWLRVTFDQ